jgi:hypothetical protein
MISTSASEARSSLNSIRGYVHEAMVLKAFLRDPAELGGLRESDTERDSSTSEDRLGESGTESDQSAMGLAGPAEIGIGMAGQGGMGSARPIKGHIVGDSRQSNYSSPRTSSSTPRRTSKRSQKSSIDSTRSRRSHEKTTSPTSSHPFAYRQPQSTDDLGEREDDAILALDDAAREIARQRAMITPVSSPGRARFDDAEEEVPARFGYKTGRV